MKPKRCDVLAGFIPAELKERNNWVLWKYTWDAEHEKWTKPPFTKTGSKASVTKPATWTDFKTAFDTYESNKEFDGIGFVLSQDDPFVGVDLDGCIDEYGSVAAWAEVIVEKFKSYTELSPSGHGLRIFIKGRLPGKGRKNGKIEIYNKERYLTLTGGIF
jgi:primase-polymerase (primpol)-like protein